MTVMIVLLICYYASALAKAKTKKKTIENLLARGLSQAGSLIYVMDDPLHAGIGQTNPTSGSPHPSTVCVDTFVNRSPITYHGGEVLTESNIYYIFYGSFTSNQRRIMFQFAQALGLSDWWKITKEYYYVNPANSEKQYVTSNIKLGGYINDNYSHGTILNDANMIDILNNSIDTNQLPADEKGLYLFLAAADVTNSDHGGSCGAYCAYQSNYDKTNSLNIKYAFLVNPAGCYKCTHRLNQDYSPNGDVVIDAMIHEAGYVISNLVTNPKNTGWYDSNGSTNQRKCYRNFGATNGGVFNGGVFNQLFPNGKRYFLYQNWSLNRQCCASAGLM